jgi:hypothetical protein
MRHEIGAKNTNDNPQKERRNAGMNMQNRGVIMVEAMVLMIGAMLTIVATR